MNTEKLDVSIIIVSHNDEAFLRDCITAVRREAGVSSEVILVDNNSADDSVQLVRSEFPEVQLIQSELDLGFAGANNRAFSVARGRHYVLLGARARLCHGGLGNAVRHMDEDPGCGIGGAGVCDSDGRCESSAMMFPSLVNDFLALSGLAGRYPKSGFFGRFARTWADPEQPAAVDWVAETFAIIRRGALQRVGYFDQDFFYYYGLVDLCRRITDAGYSVWYWPDIPVILTGGRRSVRTDYPPGCDADAELNLWRMRSAFLYYRKNHGSVTAWASLQIGRVFAYLRARKDRGRTAGNGRQVLSRRELMRESLTQAWRDTQGGRVSPTQPW